MQLEIKKMNSEVQQSHFSSPSHGAVRGRYRVPRVLS
jgi:hypothetical protein